MNSLPRQKGSDAQVGGGPAVAIEPEKKSWIGGEPPTEPEAPEMSDEELAGQLFAARTRRIRFFRPDLFGDPAWDLLLKLFATRRKRRLKVSSLSDEANLAPTTAIRHIDRLEDAELVERTECTLDQRVSFIKLTLKGTAKMRDYLASIRHSRLRKLPESSDTTEAV